MLRRKWKLLIFTKVGNYGLTYSTRYFWTYGGAVEAGAIAQFALDSDSATIVMSRVQPVDQRIVKELSRILKSKEMDKFDDSRSHTRVDGMIDRTKHVYCKSDEQWEMED